MSNKAPGLTEYEKSLILTESQEYVLKAFYSGSSSNEGFEQSELVTSYLSSAVKGKTIEYIGSSTIGAFKHFFFDVPSEVWFIVSENASFASNDKCLNNKVVEVCVVTHDEYNRIIENPFRNPNKRRVLRLTYSDDNSSRISELISKYDVSKYNIRYIERPEPIILEAGITINGKTYNEAQTSKLPEQLHRIILEHAVNAAKSIWAS